MTVKQVNKVKNPKLLQQIHATFKPLDFLDSCSKKYGDIFFNNSFGNLEALIVSNPLDLQELFNRKNKILAAHAAANEIFKPQVGENSLIVQDGEQHLKQRKLVRPPDPMKIAQLPYLTTVCQETLRIYPVVPFTFPRITLRSVNLRGYHIEANTFVTPCIYLTHHREDLYPQPQKFQPERFIQRKYSSYEFWPFGAGSRQCLGQVFALFEMKLILATILLNYHLNLQEKTPITPARRGFLVGPQDGVRMSIGVDKSS